MDVVPRQPQLLEIRPHRLGGKPLLAEVGADDRAGARFASFRPSGAEQQPVMDVLRRLAAEGPGSAAGLQLGVRTVVAAAEDVRDIRNRDRRLPSRAGTSGSPSVAERGAAEAEGAFGARLAERMRRPRGAAHTARSAAPDPRPSRCPSQSRSAEVSLAPPSTLRVGSCHRCSSSRPSCSSAKRRLATALSALPRWSEPVGLGAKRTLAIRRV